MSQGKSSFPRKSVPGREQWVQRPEAEAVQAGSQSSRWETSVSAEPGRRGPERLWMVVAERLRQGLCTRRRL